MFSTGQVFQTAQSLQESNTDSSLKRYWKIIMYLGVVPSPHQRCNGENCCPDTFQIIGVMMVPKKETFSFRTVSSFFLGDLKFSVNPPGYRKTNHIPLFRPFLLNLHTQATNIIHILEKLF